jgi:phosphoribosylamine--glycine ligase
MELPADREDAFTYVAGAKRAEDGSLRSAGGRVLGVTAVAPTLKEAIDKAYAHKFLVKFENGYSRSDIGQRALRAGKA